MKLRVLVIVAALLTVAGLALARDVSVRGYFRSNGTYVAPHMRSAPDGNFYNNWSTKGNVNPYTGEPGTKVTPPHGGYYSGTESHAGTGSLNLFDAPDGCWSSAAQHPHRGSLNLFDPPAQPKETRPSLNLFDRPAGTPPESRTNTNLFDRQ
jgi:hypothetical protein